MRALLEQAQRGEARLSISAINLGEVYCILLRFTSEENALQHIRTLGHAVSISGVDFDQTLRAAALKHRYKLGYADSFAAELALSSAATLVSADPSFEKIGKPLKWLKLPRFQ
ncbi:putative nucleic acid-binding protein [Silvibacterium bohemicum]|uniref:Putative nucleic acid-binding protein n=1 Tax=Silvibacterium bohemicum TaxID=1577686 RepID=A0A841JP79_9BACT|nr:putative nucleic acid-binding protein [Silvibacterium bohemicum]